MAKDPAFLWYWGDWQGGTATFNRPLKGAYMDLLNAQWNSGKLSLDEIKTVLGTDFGHMWSILAKKFPRDESGLYCNPRMEIEREKRKRYSESRRNNASAKHMHERMEDVNINENKKELKEEFDKLSSFKSAFKLYPNKIREGFAQAHFFTFQWDLQSFFRFQTAQAKYQKHLQANQWKQPMEFTRFIAEWEQWEHHVEPEKEKKYASDDDRRLAQIRGK